MGWRRRRARRALATSRRGGPLRRIARPRRPSISPDNGWPSSRRLAMAHDHAAEGRHRQHPAQPQGQQVAEAWDSAKDEAAGEQCKAYGAPGLMRGPIRMRISWQDDATLKVETDYGIQTTFPLRLDARRSQLHAAGRATHRRSGWCAAAAAARSVTARSRR